MTEAKSAVGIVGTPTQQIRSLMADGRERTINDIANRTKLRKGKIIEAVGHMVNDGLLHRDSMKHGNIAFTIYRAVSWETQHDR